MPRKPKTKASAPPRDESRDRDEAKALLARLHDLLLRMAHPRADETANLLGTFDHDPVGAWRALDANAWWAGAGSLAAEALREPIELPPAERADAQRELRTLLTELAELLRQRGPTNPGLSSWLLAFRNWQASGI